LAGSTGDFKENQRGLAIADDLVKQADSAVHPVDQYQN
jgi:hypothetical protein